MCWPAARPRRPRQTVTFEAPRELLSASTREATLDQITGFGVTRVRQLVYWRDYAPEPDSRTKPNFDASDPNAYPADKWDNLDGLVAAAKAHGVDVTLTLTGPVPALGDARPRRTTSPILTRRSSARSRPRSGRRYGDRGDTWSIWNEPNQPQFLKPQYKQRQADLAEALPQALPGGLRGPALDAGQRRRTRS